MADSDVDLTALEVIRRYSLAVRQPSADRAELLAALQADVAWLESGARARPTARAAKPAPAEAQKVAPQKAAPQKLAPQKVAPARARKAAPATAPKAASGRTAKALPTRGTRGR